MQRDATLCKLLYNLHMRSRKTRSQPLKCGTAVTYVVLSHGRRKLGVKTPQRRGSHPCISPFRARRLLSPPKALLEGLCNDLLDGLLSKAETADTISLPLPESSTVPARSDSPSN